MLNGDVKKLIIVGNEKSDVYCEYLSMLISCRDDEKDENGNDKTVGIADGTVDSAIWTDEIYRDNRCHTSSRQKILFIGDSKSVKNVAPNIQCFDENNYGVVIGWLGNKAVINADVDVFKKDKILYQKFYDEYVSLVKEYNNKLFDIENEGPAKFIDDRIKENLDKTKQVVNSLVGKKTVNKGEEKQDNIKLSNLDMAAAVPLVGTTSLAGLSVSIPGLAPMILASLPIPYIVHEAKESKINYDKIKEQQFRYAVLKFYLQYFNAFMELI